MQTPVFNPSSPRQPPVPSWTMHRLKRLTANGPNRPQDSATMDRLGLRDDAGLLLSRGEQTQTYEGAI